MKKVLLLSLLFCSLFSFGQFPEKVESLTGMNVTPKEKLEVLQKYGYRNFFKDENLKETYLKNKECFCTPYDSIYGKNFTIKNVAKIQDDEYYVLELSNEKLGTVFYKYSPRYNSSSGEIKIVGEIPTEFYCDKIKVEKDKFTGETRYVALIGSIGIVSLVKTINKSIERYYIGLTAYSKSSSPSIGKKGVIILLDNGQKINRPDEKIDVEVDKDADYVYSAFFKLSDNELALLKKNSFKLLIRSKQRQNNANSSKLHLTYQNALTGF